MILYSRFEGPLAIKLNDLIASSGKDALPKFVCKTVPERFKTGKRVSLVISSILFFNREIKTLIFFKSTELLLFTLRESRNSDCTILIASVTIIFPFSEINSFTSGKFKILCTDGIKENLDLIASILFIKFPKIVKLSIFQCIIKIEFYLFKFYTDLMNNKTSKFANIFQGGSGSGIILIMPPFIYSILLLAVPLIAIFSFSFWSQNYLDIDRTFTLNNYKDAWTDIIYQTLMMRSLWVSAASTLITVVLAYPIAYYISFYVPQNKKALWIFLITIPFWTSYLIRIFLWKVILGYNGVFNSALLTIGIIDEPLTFILYNVNAIIITLSHGWAPFAILPIFVSLERIDRSLMEASNDLGETPLMTFLRVTLPLSMPGVIASSLIVFIPTIGDYITPKLVGGSNGLMIANMIQLQFLKANNAPLGAALAISAMAIVGMIAIIFVLINRKHLKAR